MTTRGATRGKSSNPDPQYSLPVVSQPSYPPNYYPQPVLNQQNVNYTNIPPHQPFYPTTTPQFHQEVPAWNRQQYYVPYVPNYEQTVPAQQKAVTGTREKKIIPIVNPDTKQEIDISNKSKEEAKSKGKNDVKPNILMEALKNKESQMESKEKQIKTPQEPEVPADKESAKVVKTNPEPVLPVETKKPEEDKPEGKEVIEPSKTVTEEVEKPESVEPKDEISKPSEVKEDIEPQQKKESDEKPKEVEENKTTGDTEKSEKPSEADEAEKKAKEAEERKLRENELDKKIEQLISDTSEVDSEKKVYGRKFLVTMREIESEFKRTPCPLTQTQLTDFGLDIKNMTVTERKQANFTPTWANMKSTRSNNAYRGRTTTDGTGRSGPRQDRGMHKKLPPGRQSIERMPRFTIPTSKDAWKPDRQRTNEEIDEEKAKIKEVCKKVRSLMNKITPTSKEELINEFISYNVTEYKEQLSQVINIIFDKAVEEPKFCALYAELCRGSVDFDLRKCPGKSPFRDALLTKTQEAFEAQHLKENQEKILNLEKIEDAEKRQAEKDKLLEEQQKLRRRKFGNMTFIGHLFRNCLLSTHITQSCIMDLLKSVTKLNDDIAKGTIDEESIHCGLQLMETVGGARNVVKDDKFRQFIDRFLHLLDEAKVHCSNKIRFYIMNIIELKKNGWVPRKSVETGPKKIDEIHKEIRQEQLENEKARDQYERRHGGIRTNSNSLRKGAPTYRNSLERNRNHPDQKRAAAAANTNLTYSNVQPKNISLSQVNDSSFVKNKKEWHSGASGGGTTTPTDSSKAWTRRESSDQRKKSNANDAAAAAVAKGAGGASRRSTSQNSNRSSEFKDLTESEQAERLRIMNLLDTDLKEYENGDINTTDMIDGLYSLVGSEKYAKPDLAGIYEMCLRCAVVKKLGQSLNVSLGRLLRISLSDKSKKDAFISGAVRFVRYVVSEEMWLDIPKVWEITGEVLMNACHPHVTVDGENVKCEVLSMEDLSPVFTEARMDRKVGKYALFVDFLKRQVEYELNESGKEFADGMEWEFNDLKIRGQLEKDGLLEELESCKLSFGKSLKQVICHS